MTYRSTLQYALIFLALYALIGMAGHATRTGTEDVYPFFSWSLFARVPERIQNDFEIVVLTVRGKELTAPTEAREIPGLVDAGVNYQIYTQRVRELGRALGGEYDVPRERGAFESMLTMPVVYEVRAIQYNPIDRFLTGKTVSSSTLGTFETSSL